MPTARGIGVLIVAAAFYAAGRLFGTLELYLIAYALGILFVVSWLWTAFASRRLELRVVLDPETVVSGDRAEIRMQLHNHSRLPALDCRAELDLSAAGGGTALVGSAVIFPGRKTRSSSLSGSLWRGSYELPAARIVSGDPLGIAERSSAQPAGTSLVVLPRLGHIDDFELLAGRVLGVGLTPGASVKGAGEFRGIRPHQPGEPLSRVHWKSTAKTGILMLRETEEAPRADNLIVVDGSASAVVGERPEDTYEMSIEAAGSLADAFLERGVPVALMLHGKDDESVALEGTPAGRHHLREVLAQAAPEALVPLGEVIARALSRVSRQTSITVISPVFDRTLQTALIRLADYRIPLLLVHVSPSSFRGALPEPAEKAFLLGMQRAGITTISLQEGEDPASSLSLLGRRSSATQPGSRLRYTSAGAERQ